MVKNKFIAGLLPLFFCGSVLAHGLFDSIPSVGLAAGGLTFYGDVGKNNNISSLGSIRTGYSIFAEEELNKMLSLSLTGLFGTLSNVETAQTSSLNFETKVIQADLSIILHTENLFPRSRVTPFVGAGFGILSFNPYGDLYDNNGEKYYYWSDGSIRNQTQTNQNSGSAKILVLNYNFNTPLDPSHSYLHQALIIPLTIGFNFNIVDDFSAKLGATYFYTSSDYLDNVKANGNSDSYLYTYVSFTYKLNFLKRAKERPDDRRYDNVNFSQFDADFPAPDPRKK